jgi:type VI secretion system protein ImpF
VASILDRLLDDDPRAGDPRLDTLDLNMPAALASKLQSRVDPLSCYVFEQLLPAARATLEAYDGRTPEPQELLLELVNGLNRVIMGPVLYDPQRFSGIKLTQDTLRLIEQGRKSANPSFLNRVLLEEAYAGDIKKMRRHDAPSAGIREMKRSVSRDIEMLLNTRRELLHEVGPEYKEIPDSLLLYGLPDFTEYSLLSSQHRKIIRRAVEDALTKFEPRLKAVRVTLEAQQKYDPAMHFRIDALLRIDAAAAPEPVTFDASLHLTTSQYTIRRDV